MSAAVGRGGLGSPYGSTVAPQVTNRAGRPVQPDVAGDAGSAVVPSKPSGLSAAFTRIAGATATAVGTPWSFLSAAGIVLVWAITGPLFHFSDTWQLVINTGTTIVTFLMVFLIQNTQNRDAKALHLKLDELIRSVEAARNDLIDIEEGNDEDLERLAHEFHKVREEAPGTGVAEVPSMAPDNGKAAEDAPAATQRAA